MTRSVASVLSVVVAACGGGSDAPPDAGADAYVPVESRTLGMNDITVLVPRPAGPSTPVLLAMTGAAGGMELVPRALYTRLALDPGDVISPYEEFHVVAVRVDLCDRGQPGPCPEGVDGRLRLVLQPILSDGRVFDVALHAFYPIPAGALPGVVDELRALARIADTPITAALAVGPGFASPAASEYTDRLRALVVTYAREDRLTRLTLFAQNFMTASFNWAFRGVERDDVTGPFADIDIPAIHEPEQRAILTGAPATITYDTMPIADHPTGFATAIYGLDFEAASPAERTTALESLTAVENPMVSGAETVQCIACHTATLLTHRRAELAGVDPLAIAGRFTSTYPLSIAGGMSSTSDRSLRALGWLFDEPEISQRVVNDTAQLLTEIEARYPPVSR